jgi:hypothetical protein
LGRKAEVGFTTPTIDFERTKGTEYKPGVFLTRPELILTFVPLPTSFFALLDGEPVGGLGVFGTVDVDEKETLGDCALSEFGVLGVNFFFIWLNRVQAEFAFLKPAT